MNKVNQKIGLLRKLQSTWPRSSLFIVWESLDHVDYDDIIYDQAFNASFQ